MSLDENQKIILTPRREIQKVDEPKELVDLAKGEVRSPDLPDGYKREITGLIVPFSDRVREVLVPTQAETAQLTSSLTPPEKNHEALLFFMSNPWNYFQGQFDRHNLESPIPEIQEKIANIRERAPKIDHVSMMLLKSPIQYIREQEREKYLDQGYLSRDVDIALASDLNLTYVANLKYINTPFESKTSTETETKFSQFLNDSIDELIDISTPNEENLNHLAAVCQYLDIFTQAFLYKSGHYKLIDPKLLDKIALKLDELSKSKNKFNKRNLYPLFDFLSYFEMNNVNAGKIFSEILKNQELHHPLMDEINYQLHPENKVDETQPKIGIEIEGIFTILFGQVPEGFELGIDFAQTLPELRKNDNSLHFDSTYKKQLFDLWFFAKMTQVRGSSVHIHINNPSGDKLKIFEKLFGDGADTLRFNDLGTIEIRLNLSSYQLSDFGNPSVQTDNAFYQPQYQFVQLIEFLIDYGNNGVINEDLLKTLPAYYQHRISIELDKYKNAQEQQVDSSQNNLKKILHDAGLDDTDVENFSILLRDKISFEELQTICIKSHWNRNVLGECIKQLNRSLTFDEAVILCNQSNFNTKLINEIIKKVERKISFEEVIKICQITFWQQSVIIEALKKMDRRLSIKEVINFYDRSHRSIDAIVAALQYLDHLLSTDNVLECLKTTYYNIEVAKECFNHLRKPLSIEEAILILDESRWNERLLIEILDHLDRPLTTHEAILFCTKSYFRVDPTEKIFKYLDPTLSKEQILDLFVNINWNIPALVGILENNHILLTPQDTLDLMVRTQNNRHVLVAALKHTENSLSKKQVMELIESSGYDLDIIEESFRHSDFKISVKEALELINKVNWDLDVVEQVVKHIDGTITIQEAIDFIHSSQMDIKIACEVIKLLSKSREIDFKLVYDFLSNLSRRDLVILSPQLLNQFMFTRPINLAAVNYL